MSELLSFDNKAIRAQVIAEYLGRAGRFESGVVCFTCGNAARALAREGLYVVDIGSRGGLSPNRWWQPCEIAKTFPTFFDATSGHLPHHLMALIGEAFRKKLGALPKEVRVPSGSGETACCLALAYPEVNFVACYDDADPATTYSASAPLNGLVEKLCWVERF